MKEWSMIKRLIWFYAAKMRKTDPSGDDSPLVGTGKVGHMKVGKG